MFFFQRGIDSLLHEFTSELTQPVKFVLNWFAGLNLPLFPVILSHITSFLLLSMPVIQLVVCPRRKFHLLRITILKSWLRELLLWWLVVVNYLKIYLERNISPILYLIFSMVDMDMTIMHGSCGKRNKSILIKLNGGQMKNYIPLCRKWLLRVVAKFLVKGHWKEAWRTQVLLIPCQIMFIFNPICQIHSPSPKYLWVTLFIVVTCYLDKRITGFVLGRI